MYGVCKENAYSVAKLPHPLPARPLSQSTHFPLGRKNFRIFRLLDLHWQEVNKGLFQGGHIKCSVG